MSAGLFWLASSEHERRRAMELAAALRQKESRDELGLGSIRDGLADLLFPGTSTQHTRARYHLFVPWAFTRAAAQASSQPLGRRVREQEVRLIAGLKNASDTSGLIGAQAGSSLQNMPSALYWQGLLTWGVRCTPGSRRVIERMMTVEAGRRERDDDGDAVDSDAATVWHHHLPVPPKEFPAEATFALRRSEAEFLVERLRTEPGTRGSALEQLAGLPGGDGNADHIWEHPSRELLNRDTRVIIDQARRVWALLDGTSRLYNVILAHMAGNQELEGECRDRFGGWSDTVAGQLDDLADWDLGELWSTLSGRVPGKTCEFVISWQRLVGAHEPAALVDNTEARALVIDRERHMKGAAARTLNQKALDQWGGASGIALDFRWSTARGLIRDVRGGLGILDAQN